MSYEPKRPVLIEEVLRLKRAERPPPEFWDRFDRELRAKQLAALVEKRPWWRRLPAAFAGLTRYQLPIGATAMLALAALSVRHYQSNTEPTSAPVSRAQVGTTLPQASAEPRLEPAELNRAAVVTVVTPSLSAEEPASGEQLEVVRTAPIVAGVEAPTMATVLGLATAPDFQAESAPATLVAVGDLSAANGEPVLAGSLLSVASAESRTSFGRSTPIEPLQQVTPPSEMRRVKVLAALAVNSAANGQSRNLGRLAQRIPEDRLTEDGIRRIRARGDRVLVSF